MRNILLLFISLVVGGCSCSQLSTTVCSIDSIAVYINDTLYIAKPFVSKDMAKTEHSHPLGMVVSTHFRCGKWVKRGLKNGALPFTSYEGV